MIEITNKYLTGYKYIDLFAGIGGFHLALSSLGAECVYANEWDSFAQKVYKENFGI
ncbi:MAG: DNA cytosine methyltransferase, partial [Spirochaetia bacterium]|nr:DNA cytosine methyltransferase [Spirochaetia bacterium]